MFQIIKNNIQRDYEYVRKRKDAFNLILLSNYKALTSLQD